MKSLRAKIAEVREMLETNLLKGGLGDNLTPKDVDPVQFRIGMQVEKEHSKDLRQVKEIVLDHLYEDPKYYTKLKKAKL